MDFLGFDFNTLFSNDLFKKGLAILFNGLIGLLIFFIGKFIAQKVSAIVKKAMENSHLDDTLVSFLSNIIFGVLMMVVIMAALGQVGVKTNSIIAIIGGMAVAIGLALQDQLSNFAAGVIIILFRPFTKGDFVKINGNEGTIEEVSLVTTSLRTLNNHEIIIPNSQVTTNSVINYTSMPNRRVDVQIGISYGADIKTAKDLMTKVARQHELVFTDPQPNVMVTALNDSSVDLLVCVWTSNADWLKVKCDLQEAIKYAFDEHGIEIPFPQTVIHMAQKA